MRTQHWSQATVDQQIIKLYSKSEISNFSELDTSSIMMYVPQSFLCQHVVSHDPSQVLYAG